MENITVGDVVEVVKSQDLLDNKLKGLIGRSGVVVELANKKSTHIRLLQGAWEEESEWCIPNESIKITRKYKPMKHTDVEAELHIDVADGVSSVISED